MKITRKHPKSVFGYPVILDEDDVVLEMKEGVHLVRKELGLSQRDLARLCGVSVRTAEGWESGRKVSAAALNVMQDLLKADKS